MKLFYRFLIFLAVAFATAVPVCVFLAIWTTGSFWPARLGGTAFACLCFALFSLGGAALIAEENDF